MRKTIIILILIAFVCFFHLSCCPNNPQLNSAITAHGNTDWHVDTAEEFLTGSDMGGSASAANHCPSSWTTRHMHVGLTNTNHFYYDPDLSATGDDDDATNGIDKAMLFFYAGHGNPTTWSTLGNTATQDYLSLGDCPGTGYLRYYWQCSCEVFAHGPRTCAGSTHVYTCPGDFDGSSDSNNMRNVYERWGPALTPALRMAGGASTDAYCHEYETNRIWNNYNNNGYDVADSFIDGLAVSYVVPLCITMGGSDVTLTPLYDSAFTNHPNTSGNTYYHIQYLSHFASTPTSPPLIVHLPELLPIYIIRPLPLPDRFKDIKFIEKGEWLVSPKTIPGRGPEIRIHRNSGSVYIAGERQASITEPVLKEQEYIEKAVAYVEEKGLAEKEFAKPMGRRFELESTPVEDLKAAKKAQKNVIVTLKRQINVEGAAVNVLGEGGVIRVQMNNDGSVFNATKVWRQIVKVKKMARVKAYEEALKEALAQIEEPDMYKVDAWNWGYKERAGNVKQEELGIVFQFEFAPKEHDAVFEYPPIFMEIQGQEE